MDRWTTEGQCPTHWRRRLALALSLSGICCAAAGQIPPWGVAPQHAISTRATDTPERVRGQWQERESAWAAGLLTHVKEPEWRSAENATDAVAMFEPSTLPERSGQVTEWRVEQEGGRPVRLLALNPDTQGARLLFAANREQVWLDYLPAPDAKRVAIVLREKEAGAGASLRLVQRQTGVLEARWSGLAETANWVWQEKGAFYLHANGRVFYHAHDTAPAEDRALWLDTAPASGRPQACSGVYAGVERSQLLCLAPRTATHAGQIWLGVVGRTPSVVRWRALLSRPAAWRDVVVHAGRLLLLDAREGALWEATVRTNGPVRPRQSAWAQGVRGTRLAYSEGQLAVWDHGQTVTQLALGGVDGVLRTLSLPGPVHLQEVRWRDARRIALLWQGWGESVRRTEWQIVEDVWRSAEPLPQAPQWLRVRADLAVLGSAAGALTAPVLLDFSRAPFPALPDADELVRVWRAHGGTWARWSPSAGAQGVVNVEAILGALNQHGHSGLAQVVLRVDEREVAMLWQLIGHLHTRFAAVLVDPALRHAGVVPSSLATPEQNAGPASWLPGSYPALLYRSHCTDSAVATAMAPVMAWRQANTRSARPVLFSCVQASDVRAAAIFSLWQVGHPGVRYEH